MAFLAGALGGSAGAAGAGAGAATTAGLGSAALSSMTGPATSNFMSGLLSKGGDVAASSQVSNLLAALNENKKQPTQASPPSPTSPYLNWMQ